MELLVVDSNTWNHLELLVLEIIDIIWLCANEWLILNGIISIWQKYLKSFNCVQTNK